MYDAIVVGARVAGSATALSLARYGYKVLVVDRSAVGSDTLSTHFLHLSGMALLRSWGLDREVRESGCPPLQEVCVDFGPFAIRGRPAPAGDVDEMFCCRRTVLDPLLVRAASASGAEIRDRTTVNEVVSEGGRVVGVRGHDSEGAPFTARAPIVIGADGLHSRVAELVGAPVVESAPPLTAGYYGYWSGIDLDHALLAPRPGTAVALMPTNDGQTCVFVCLRREEFHEFRRDVEANFRSRLELVPHAAELVRGGRLESKIRGTGDLPNVVRRARGPGWALVGDAGWHKDPITAQGISDALRDADFLAEAIHEGLSGHEDLDVALARFETRRDAAETPRYRFTTQLATLEPPPPPMAEQLAAVAKDPGASSAFLGLFAGTTPFEAFFRTQESADIPA